MPGFFDFTDFTQPMSPAAPSLDDQGWGGGVMQPQQPMVPENYDIFGSGMPQMPQQAQGQVPYDALGAMAGIQMPEIPQQDDMGRYGITDSQRQGAGYQSLAEILRGAGATLFNDRPDDVMAAAARSGDIRRGALDKASLENVNAFKLKADVEAKKLDMIGKMSDIQRQQLQIESEKMKLEDLKRQREVAVEFGNEMAPVMTEILNKTAAMYPDKVGVVKAKLLVAKEKLAAGDLAGADVAFENAKMELPSEWQTEMEEQMTRQSLEAATKRDMAFELASDPSYIEKVKAIGGSIEAGPNGVPTFVSAHELQQRQLEIARINASIEAEKARAASYSDPARGGRGSRLTAAGVNSALKEINLAVAEYNPGPPPDLKDQGEQEAYHAKQAKYKAIIDTYGIDPDQWRTLDDNRRKALINGGATPAGGTVKVGASAAGAGFGGSAMSPAGATGMFIKSKGSNPATLKVALNGLRNSGDPNLARIVDSAIAKFPRPENAEEAAITMEQVYAEVYNQLNPQKR